MSGQQQPEIPQTRHCTITVHRRCVVQRKWLIPGKSHVVPRSVARAVRVAGNLATCEPVGNEPSADEAVWDERPVAAGAPKGKAAGKSGD